MKELTEYEIQKAKHKRLLVRNERQKANSRRKSALRI